MMKEEKVSILVRTCGRPEILKNCIESIKAQTYKNIEIVVVEDGAQTAKALVDSYPDLDIKYHCNGEKKGRVYTGNKALSMATGKYLNFLDDDDLFYEDHVQTLVEAIEQVDAKVVYSVAEVGKTYYSKRKQQNVIWKKTIRYRQPFNRLYLLYENYIPIQTALYDRELYDTYGGFAEDMDYLEDWDMWVRYVMHTDFYFVDKVTSVYMVPISNGRRQDNLSSAYIDTVKRFEKYVREMTAYDLNREVRQVINYTKPRMRRKIRDLFVKLGIIKYDNLNV